MANEIQNVKIMTNEINLRATSLRARLTDVVAIYKCGDFTERCEAMDQFDLAVSQFKKALSNR